MKYRVTAFMSVMLETIVDAESIEEAIVKGKSEADIGAMREMEREGSLYDWQAMPVRGDST